MLRSLTNVIFPTRFQGLGQTRRYFEGYYFKIVDPPNQLALALIPGVSFDAQGCGHAFIQVLDGVAGKATYHRYSILDFAAPQRSVSALAKTGFTLSIDGHCFSEFGLRVKLADADVEVSFRQNQAWPWRWWSPGAMGPFTFIPRMECRHGVVSLHHQVIGTINGCELSGEAVGYIEKDWGRSFPRQWVWLQTNHLVSETEPCCLMVSAGRVPLLGTSFTGFIAALWWRGRFLPFTTYNGARIDIELAEDSVQLDFRRRLLRLKVVAHHAPGVELMAPAHDDGMVGRVNESLLAWAEVELWEGKQALLQTRAEWVGFEVGG